MKQEVWDYLSDPIFQKISIPNILDLGSGPGNAFFHFYHNYNKIKYRGFEEKCKQDIEKNECSFRDYKDQKIKNKIKDHFEYPPYKFNLHKYYTFIAKRIIKPERNKILNKEEFQRLFVYKVKWRKKAGDYFKEKNPYNEFDVIILSKVLHYQCFKKSELLIKKYCYQALKTNGVIFISVPNDISENSKKKYKYMEADIRKLTTQFKEIDSNLQEENENKELLFYLGSKYGI